MYQREVPVDIFVPDLKGYACDILILGVILWLGILAQLVEVLLAVPAYQCVGSVLLPITVPGRQWETAQVLEPFPNRGARVDSRLLA